MGYSALKSNRQREKGKERGRLVKRRGDSDRPLVSTAKWSHGTSDSF